jgi:hypothetical protein
MRYTIREYSGKNIDPQKISNLAEQFFREEGFIVQAGKGSKGYVVQARKGGFFRTLLAMNRAFTVVVDGNYDDFTVKLGVAEWLADLGMAAIESLFLSPAIAFIEVPEALWTFEIEHQLWHFLENQIQLGIQ